jgi:hypothetical protein
MGMDCLYCHNTVETAAVAAVPPTSTCMNCHANVLPESSKLARIRESAKNDVPVKWVRVHMLPDYSYFDHSVHIKAGVGCASCHGRIDQMPVVAQAKPLSMGWCLECHRAPEAHLRPASAITNMAWDSTTANYRADEDPKRLRKVKDLHPPEHCSGCHR